MCVPIECPLNKKKKFCLALKFSRSTSLHEIFKVSTGVPILNRSIFQCNFSNNSIPYHKRSQSSEKDQTFLWYQFCSLNLPHYHHIKMSRFLEQISLFIALEFINQLLLLKSQNCFLDFLVKTTKPSSNMTSTRNPSSGSQPWNRHFFWTLNEASCYRILNLLR